MKLFLIVIDFSIRGEKQEAEWLHTVSHNVTYGQAKELALSHLEDNVAIERDDVELDNVWVNTIEHVNGYDIKLEG